MTSRLAIAALSLILSLAVPVLARAQQVDRIAAVVNDEIISIQDVEQRLRMAIIMSNLPDTIENRRRVLGQVVRKMIDERLQMQEANRLKISMTAKEVEDGIAGIERNNRMAPGQMLAQLSRAGIDPDIVRGQIRADLTWMKVAARVLLPTVRIGTEEINERLETIRARQGKPEYLLAEIFLAVDNPSQEDEARRLGDRLIEQLRTGAPFPALANQFSQSPTAANGGSMGWVAESSIDDDLRATVLQLNPGQVSGLVRASDGFHILALVEKRIAGASQSDAVVTLAQVIFPVPPKDAPPRAMLVSKAQEMASQARTCDGMIALGKQIYPEKSGLSKPTKVSELAASVRRAVANLNVGQLAPPIDTAEGIAMMMVCSRENIVEVKEPSEDAIRRAIEDERVDMLSRRYLRDLRRSAFIELRL
ncbi:MAG: peptidylprolyl isomerase [Actinomycetota bacterium]